MICLINYCSASKTYLKCEFGVPHHISHPAQSLINEPEYGEKGDQIGCNVSHKAY